MRPAGSWRLVKLLAVSIVLVLSVQVLVSSLERKMPKTSIPTLDESRILSPETYKYILNQPAACKDKNPFLIIMVPVAPQQFKARETIRKTWGAPGRETITLFFTGLPEAGRKSGVQEELEEESRRHADIIQMNFRDSYQNLTIKTVMIMNWLATRCSNADYVLKVDADIFVNVFYLVEWLRSSPRRGFITGSLINDGKPRRDRNSKWYVSEEQYPEDSFPPYLSGAGYVFSSDLAPRISRASRFVRMINLEDVYTGLCLRALGVRPAYAFGLLGLRNLFEIRNLDYDRCRFAKLIIVNGFAPSELLRVWPDFSSGHDRC